MAGEGVGVGVVSRRRVASERGQMHATHAFASLLLLVAQRRGIRAEKFRAGGENRRKLAAGREFRSRVTGSRSVWRGCWRRGAAGRRSPWKRGQNQERRGELEARQQAGVERRRRRAGGSHQNAATFPTGRGSHPVVGRGVNRRRCDDLGRVIAAGEPRADGGHAENDEQAASHGADLAGAVHRGVVETGSACLGNDRARGGRARRGACENAGKNRAKYVLADSLRAASEP
jgi:hypothetical protein